MDFRKTVFVKSAAKASDFPRDMIPRVVFVGRSNVGKSSTINAVVGKKGFARVSSVPGKTVFVNLFKVDEKGWLIDLPGYGYSKTSKEERDRYSRLIEDYFAAVRPVPYLDDISTKNLLIRSGRVSGVIDVDWMGIGDKLTYVAMTNMALLNMECDTMYVQYILEEMQVTAVQRRAFLFYTLMFCVDFMGERGMQFMDKKVEVNQQIIDRMNGIYDKLWKEWSEGERA